MSVCWSCHWGWTEPVAAIYEKALSALEGDDTPLLYGPAHIVWSDENFDAAEWCLDNFAQYERNEYSVAELAIVWQSLQELEALPLDARCVEPDNYDGEHPEQYPPARGVRMKRVRRDGSTPGTED